MRAKKRRIETRKRESEEAGEEDSRSPARRPGLLVFLFSLQLLFSSFRSFSLCLCLSGRSRWLSSAREFCSALALRVGV